MATRGDLEELLVDGLKVTKALVESFQFLLDELESAMDYLQEQISSARRFNRSDEPEDVEDSLNEAQEQAVEIRRGLRESRALLIAVSDGEDVEPKKPRLRLLPSYDGPDDEDDEATH